MILDPFFFGPPQRRLFGILTQPNQRSTAAGAVICAPLGQEAIRSHRSLRLLAENLAQAGLSTLRFDYYGTGDSGGDLFSAQPREWVEDIQVATQELRERAGVTRMILVGLRLGGFLATVAEVRAVGRLILWDPITDAQEYAKRARAQGSEDESGGLEWQGFYYPAGFMDELSALSLENVRRVPREVKIVVSQESPGMSLFREALKARKARVEDHRIDAPPAWFEERALGAGAVPIGVLHRIREWVN
jgi:pimeloyl-ACP methyl ester carboxylesterase